VKNRTAARFQRNVS